MAKKDYTQLTKSIVEYIGGVSNVKSVTHCMTRLRFVLNDEAKADTAKVEKLDGVIQVIKGAGQYQVVIGQQVADVYEELLKINGIKGDSGAKEETTSQKPQGIRGWVDLLIGTITGIFTPILGALTAAGVLKGILISLAAFGVLSNTSGTYRILYASCDSVYTYLPIFLAFTAAKKFNANKFVSVAIAGALVYPDIAAAYSAGEAITFLGIPVVLISYTSTVLPIIIAVYAQSKLEKIIKKVLPGVIRDLLYPVISLLVIAPATFLVIGPITDWLGNSLATVTTAAMQVAPIPVGFIFCFVWPLVVMAGLHWGFIAVALNTMAVAGRETMVSATGPLNFAQAGATLGVFLKTKNKGLKEISGQAFVAAGLAGVTEPAMYGVTLKYKKPFYFVMLFAGVSGAIMAVSGAGATAFASLSILTWGTYMGQGFTGFIIACLVAFFGPLVCTYLFGFNDSMLDDANTENDTTSVETKEVTAGFEIGAPIEGDLLPLSGVKDPAFSSGAMGDGLAIDPKKGIVYSPFDGTLAALFPTKHALGLEADNGVEVLIHVGLDTVNLEGKYFEALVKQGDRIKKGQELLKFDIEAIKKAGYSVVTPVIITSMGSYEKLEKNNSASINTKEKLMELK